MGHFAYSVPSGESASSARPGTATARDAQYYQHQHALGAVMGGSSNSHSSRSDSLNSDTAPTPIPGTSFPARAAESLLDSRFDYAPPPLHSGGLASAGASLATMASSSSFGAPGGSNAGNIGQTIYNSYPPRSSGGLPPSSYSQQPPGSSHGATTSTSATSLSNDPNSAPHTNNASSGTDLWGYSISSPPQTAQSQNGLGLGLTGGPPGTGGSNANGLNHYSIHDHNQTSTSSSAAVSAALAAGIAMPSTSSGHPPYHGYNLSNT